MLKTLPGVILLFLFLPARVDASAITMADFSAGATKLNFETLTSNVTVSNQFSGLNMYGMKVAGGDPDVSAVYSGAIALAFSNLYRTGPTTSKTGPWRLVATTGDPASDSIASNVGIIGAQFIDPVTGNAATTNKAGAWFYTDNWGAGSTAYGQISVFGIDGTLLESLKVFGGASKGGYFFLGIAIAGIHRVEFTTGYSDHARGADGFNIDDLIFEPMFDSGSAPIFKPPPPPSTVPDGSPGVWLIAVMLIGLCYSSTRRARNADTT